ncbi:MFS transporter [Amycolatopsis endophytica]|uniref:Sugar phosphate permease n=1 Tax=Amycolatopsis endophytica TaxID=860233 RepID=A0A853B646_9PSEU|nr:MFS transporter [Amycolatopsis endophytica]NYI90211.1 sugar phosphate permease [Amycolatopsis endophytica]
MESPPVTGTAATLGRQRWMRLIPIVFVTYSLAYLDRSNFSIAAAGGMSEDLGITSSTSGLIAASFFAGYFLLQVPGVLYADRRSVRDLIFWSVLAWGALATLQGLLSSVPLLIVVRFLLGAVEAAVLPALVVLLARWFTKAERGRANAFLILGNPVTVMWLSAASGYLIEATSWRGMFIIEGVPALIWAFYFRAQVRDRPADAPWLAPAERNAVDTAIAAEQAGLAPPTGTRHPLLDALRSRDVLVLSAQYLLWSIGVYGFVFWLPSIVKAGLSAGIGATGLLSAVPYAFAVVAMLLNSRGSDRANRRIRYVWPWLLAGAVTFYGSYLAGHDAFWLSFALLVLAGIAMYAPYGPFFAMIPELLPRRTASVAVALVNAAGALGGFLGTYLVGWLRTATGTDAAAFLMLAGTMAASAVVLFAVRPPEKKTP